MFGKRKKRKCTQTEMGQTIYEEIISHKELYEEMKKTIKKDSRTHSNEAEKTAIDSLDEKRIEWESFYLWVFLTTYCIQNQFSDYAKEGTKQILDSVHRCIGEKMFRLEHRIDLQNAMNLRFSQYYKAIKADIRCLGQPDCIVFGDLTEKYFENLFEREIRFSEFGASRLLFGVLVAEIISLLNDTLSKLRENYDIIFES